MANRPINTPSGIFTKHNLRVSSVSGNGIIFDGYSTTTVLVSANTTGLIVAGGVRVSGSKYVRGNSTGFIFTAASAKPSARSAAKWAFYTNSTGTNAILVNTTGTTWKFARVTASLNSTSGY